MHPVSKWNAMRAAQVQRNADCREGHAYPIGNRLLEKIFGSKFFEMDWSKFYLNGYDLLERDGTFFQVSREFMCKSMHFSSFNFEDNVDAIDWWSSVTRRPVFVITFTAHGFLSCRAARETLDYFGPETSWAKHIVMEYETTWFNMPPARANPERNVSEEEYAAKIALWDNGTFL